MNLIAQTRKRIGKSQIQLASKLKWSQSRLANYENGYRTPSLDDCRKIVSALNILGADCEIDDVFPPE